MYKSYRVYTSFAMFSLFENMQNEFQNYGQSPFWGYLFIEKKTDLEFWLHRSLLKHIKQEAPTEL